MATRRGVSPEEIRLRLAMHLKVPAVPESIWLRLVEGEDFASIQARPDDEAEWGFFLEKGQDYFALWQDGGRSALAASAGRAEESAAAVGRSAEPASGAPGRRVPAWRPAAGPAAGVGADYPFLTADEAEQARLVSLALARKARQLGHVAQFRERVLGGKTLVRFQRRYVGKSGGGVRWT